MPHQRTNSVEEIAGSGRRSGFGGDNAVNVRPLQEREPLVAMLGTETLEDVAADPARLGSK